MLDNYYDSYGYKLPESFITMAERKGVKFPPSKTISQKRTELESFFSESGQMTGDLNQSPLLMKPIPEPQHDYSKDYLTFEVLEDGNIFFVFNESVKSDLLRYISYSTDNGESWITEENPYTEQEQGALRLSFGNQSQGSGNTDSIENAENIESDFEEIYIDASDVAIEIDKEDDNENSLSWKDIFGKKSQNGLVTIPVVAGDKIIFKGDATTYGVMNESSVPAYCHFGSDCKFNIYGNIMSLCYGDGFKDKKKLMHECQFAAIFRDSSGCHVVDASNLSLPATELSESCYRTMFYGCSDLVSGPQLPATKLAPNCYKSFYYNCSSLVSVGDLKNAQMYYRSCQFMFYKCSSLKKAPKLPSKILGEACYQHMFNDCTSLTEAPELPATTLAEMCYSSMFYNCSSLTDVPSKIGGNSMPTSACTYMFQYCTSLTKAPELPVTNLGARCYQTMFGNCTSLTKAPELPARNLSDFCYAAMFMGCKSLRKTPELPAMKLATASYYAMFSGCTSLNSIENLGMQEASASGCAFMFSDCTSLTNAPDLQPKTMYSWTYLSMFDRCTSLIAAPKLFATKLSGSCYMQMFRGCTSLVEAPELPVTELYTQCYSNMFSGCTALTEAPELPATKMERWCYSHMFGNCTSLTTAPELLATTLEDNCYRSMLAGCSRLNYVKCLADTLEPQNAFTNWLTGVSSSGTFVKKAGVEWPSGYYGIPEGWTVEEVVDEI